MLLLYGYRKSEKDYAYKFRLFYALSFYKKFKKADQLTSRVSPFILNEVICLIWKFAHFQSIPSFWSLEWLVKPL